jgi:uncharacterized protein YxjI
MRYMMKQKLSAWGDDFYIKDQNGEDVIIDMACHADQN